MKDLSQYRVSFPFGATTDPYSPSHPHSGEDRAAPAGTPIIVSGTTIGFVGATGKVTGPHCHIQKATWTGSTWKFVNPAGGGLNITGEVIEVGYNSEIGNFVRIKDNSGVRWSYFHMVSAPSVKVGQKIGGTPVSVVGDRELSVLYRMRFGRRPDKGAQAHIGKDFTQLDNELLASDEYKRVQERVRAGHMNPTAFMPEDLQAMSPNPLNVNNS